MNGSWDDLAKPGTAPQAPPADSEFDTLCMQVFTSPPGKLLIAKLRARYFDAPMSGQAGEAALRQRINQQQFIRELELACERGIKAVAARQKAG